MHRVLRAERCRNPGEELTRVFTVRSRYHRRAGVVWGTQVSSSYLQGQIVKVFIVATLWG